MKSLLFLATTVFWVAFASVLGVATCSGQDTNSAIELAYGLATNGVRAELELISHPDDKAPSEIVVWIHHIADTNPTPSDDLMFENMLKRNWDYYMATNSFCGPIELRDSNGRSVSLLKPEVCLSAAYPASYSLQAEHSRWFSQFTNGYSGDGIFPLPLFFATARTEMARFQLGESLRTKIGSTNGGKYARAFQLRDYFDVRTPGEYQFTVRPKIYQRSAADRDICVRIDVPAVTATFKWLAPPPR